MPNSSKKVIINSLIFLAVFYLFRMAFKLFVTRNLSFNTDENLLHYTIYIVIIELCLVLIAIAFIALSHKQKPSFSAFELSFKKDTFRQILKGIILGCILVGAVLLIQMIIGTLNFLYTGFRHNPPEYIFRAIILGFIICIAVAIGEEVLFRGYILNYLHSKQNPIKALLISSLIFTLAHVGKYWIPLQLLSVFSVSLLYGTIFLVYKSLWASIGTHFIYDFILITVLGAELKYAEASRLLVFRVAPYKITVYNFVIDEIYIGASNDIITIAVSLTLALILYTASISNRRRLAASE